MYDIFIVQCRLSGNDVIICITGKVKDLAEVVGFFSWDNSRLQGKCDVLYICSIQDTAFKFFLATEVPVVGPVTFGR